MLRGTFQDIDFSKWPLLVFVLTIARVDRAIRQSKDAIMVKSANRTIEIFELIGARGQLKQGDIIKLMGIPKSSASVLLDALTQSGYLKLDPTTRLYSLGPQFVTLAGRYLSNLDIVRISQPILRELTSRIDESSFLLCRSEDEVIVMWREFCTHPLAYMMQLGERAPMTITAAGLAILAYLDRDDWPAVPASNAKANMAKVNAIKPENLERQLAGVRNGDAALTKDLLVSGVVSLGRPLFDHEHKVNAAITVTIPAIRYKPQHLRNIEQQLTLAAGRISEQLGYRPQGTRRRIHQ